jgi:hypothetical protein
MAKKAWQTQYLSFPVSENTPEKGSISENWGKNEEENKLKKPANCGKDIRSF